MKDSRLYDVGEFGLIEAIRRWVNKNKRVSLGIGDDAALVQWPSKSGILFTTDMLIEGRHFRLGEASPYEIGWKAMAVNLSDIAAMGGVPNYAVVCLGLPQSQTVGFVRDMYRGLEAVSKKFGVSVVGGDTNLADKVIISIALLGTPSKRGIALRSGAKEGDVIFVSGELGGSYASKKHLSFTPRIREAAFLMKHFKIHSMMDLSDGLASDIHRLTKESHVGALLMKEALPVSSQVKTFSQALSDGEDFELLFTLPPREAARLTLWRKTPKLAEFHPIGKVMGRRFGVRLIGAEGVDRPLQASGFDHFKK